VREQAYTVLNRLAALRMAEARGLLIESRGPRLPVQGFQLYAHLAGPAWAKRARPTAASSSACSTSWPWSCPRCSTASARRAGFSRARPALLRLLDLLNAP
jgi:hypothetical protein